MAVSTALISLTPIMLTPRRVARNHGRTVMPDIHADAESRAALATIDVRRALEQPGRGPAEPGTRDAA
jgi:hypothetical protein